MTDGGNIPEDWARAHVSSQDPRVLAWLDRCWICPAPGSPACELQINWKRLDSDAFMRAVAWAESDLGVNPPAECWPDRCQVIVHALDTEPDPTPDAVE